MQLTGTPIRLTIDGQAYAPQDTLPTGEIAADAVYAWTLDPARTWEDLDAAHTYLSQWPQGPRLEIGLPRASRLLGITRSTLGHRVARGLAQVRRTDLGDLIPWPEVVRQRDEPPAKGRPWGPK